MVTPDGNPVDRKIELLLRMGYDVEEHLSGSAAVFWQLPGAGARGHVVLGVFLEFSGFAHT